MATIFHIDVNSAYLSWTARERLKQGAPDDIRTVASAIAGDPAARRGIILAKSEAAKACGVTTGETVSAAFKKCPGLKLYPPDHDLYAKCSEEFNDVLERYSPVIERFSIDESFMDYTDSEKLFGEPVAAAHEIKDTIKNELGFTVNVGVSVNKLLAKMASDFSKPDRVHTLFPDEIESKMWPLPLGELFSVGRKSRKKLIESGFKTIGDLAGANPGYLKALLGQAHGQTVHDYANGIGDAAVVPNDPSERKGIGNSMTIPYDVRTPEAADKILLALCEKSCSRLRAAGFYAAVVSVTIRPADFSKKRYGHQRRLSAPTCATTEIYELARQLFREVWKGEPVRLLGITFGEIVPDKSAQLNMFDTGETDAHEELDRTVDEIRQKFGSDVIKRGRLTGDKDFS
ncbi:MAG: DNA polymerase IV [Clostridiales Family XIII bacterium]|jgi:DNA polymerase-4|nr:DNA polymerase IV [Clostridiales Family XIII bacterium]